MDLELARADGRRHAAALSPALLERPRDLRLARAVEPQHAPFGFTRAREHLAHRLRLERPRPQPPQLARRPREHDDRATLGLEHERRRRPLLARARAPCARAPTRARAARAGATHWAALAARPPRPARSRARARAPCRRSRPRARLPAASPACARPRRSRRRAGRAARRSTGRSTRSRLQLLVDDQLAAGGPRHQLDRPVVVRRPETARDAAELGLEPLAQRDLELVRVVADDRDPRRLDAEPQELRGEERPVQVAPVAADELAAGDDDEPARAAQAAREKPCGVKLVRAGAAEVDDVAVVDHRQVPRVAEVDPEPARDEALRLAGLDGAR